MKARGEKLLSRILMLLEAIPISPPFSMATIERKVKVLLAFE